MKFYRAARPPEFHDLPNIETPDIEITTGSARASDELLKSKLTKRLDARWGPGAMAGWHLYRRTP